MNWIEHIIEPRRLILAWQAPEELQNRHRFAVGEVTHDDSKTVLKYFLGTNDYNEAAHLGYRGYPAFRLNEREHASGVLEAFARRLPPEKRSDFSQYKESLRVRADAKISTFGLLAYSGGKLPSDGFSFVDPFEDTASSREFIYELAGYRYYAKDAGPISLGARLAFEFEPNNPKDPNAIVVRQAGRKLGYVNRLQTTSFRTWLNEGRLSGELERLNGVADHPRAFAFVRINGNG